MAASPASKSNHKNTNYEQAVQKQHASMLDPSSRAKSTMAASPASAR
jgi:hypothetical protein